MPSYEVGVSLSVSVEANTEEQAFQIAHSYLTEIHDTPPSEFTSADGEIVSTEEIG